MKTTSLFRLTVLVGSLALVSASALADNSETGETNAYKSDTSANYKGVMKSIPHCTVLFDQGSSVVTENDQSKLHDLVTNIANGKKVAKISVAAWSDKPFPKDHVLSMADRDLADMRADNIKKILKEDLAGNVDVATFSLAEDSNWLGRAFKTDDSELKSVFSKKNANAPVTHAEYRMIKNEGGPSTAVVVVEYK